MKVSQNKIDDLNLELTIEVEAADYAEIERKKLAERKRTADFKGFRKGMAPASLIKKFFGEQCLVEAVNQVLSQALDAHIKDNSLRIIGEPLSSENQPEVEWKDGNNFTFVFDLGLYPEINFDVVKDDKVPSYTVTISAKDKATMVENLKKYYDNGQTKALNGLNLTIKKGEAIGQAVFQKYFVADNDAAEGERVGGFGSTSK